MTIVLALDLGVNIGWVRGAAVGPHQHGTFVLPTTTDLGRWLAASDEFFRDALQGVDVVACEKPYLGQDYYATRKLVSLLGHCAYWCRHTGVPDARQIEVPIATGKLTLSGDGRANGAKMIAAAAERGYPGMNDHEAHALGVWWVAVFGKADPIAKRRTTNGKPVRVAP